MGLKKRGNIWYARFQFGGHETWISTGKTSKRDAEKAEARIAAEFERERTGRQLANALINLAKQLAIEEITLEQCKSALPAIDSMAILNAMNAINDIFPASALMAPELWEKYLSSSPELKPSTMDTKQKRFNKFASWAGERDMRLFSESDCRRFLKSLNTTASQTINNYISDLSSVWKQSSDLKNPWGEHLRMKSNVKNKLPFTREHIKTIIKYCEDHHLEFWRSAVTIGYYTGLRLIDIIYFNVIDISKDGYIEIKPKKTERNHKKVRMLITPYLKEELDRVYPSGTLEFWPDKIKQYERDRSLVTKEFREILDATKIYKLGYGFHSLRHTFITTALDAGIPTKDVQSIVGQDAIAITEGIYYHGKRNADITAYPKL